ncbi:MAG: glycosyltransferase family 4 protein [Planctomycetales bacterium]|nr:glycosyltransferase family 4 protein [Planctomycetales bacterium]
MSSKNSTPTSAPANAKSIVFVCLGEWDSTLCLRAKSMGTLLRPMGWQVHFALPPSPANAAAAQADSSLHIVPRNPLRFALHMRRWLRQVNPRFVHFLNPEVKASLVAAACPKVKIVGDWEDWHACERDRGMRRVATNLSDRYMRRRSDIVLVASRWLAKRFAELGRTDTHYIPYATLPREFPDLPNPFQRPTAVYMGNLAPQWDHDIVVSAAKLLKDRGYDFPICLIGRGADFERCQAEKKRLDLSHLELPGFLPWDEMLNRLRWAHVLLFPIRDKVANLARCPFKIFQYAQAQRPVITSAVGEVPTYLGQQAIYVDSSPEGFAEAIAQAMVQPRSPAVDYGINAHTWEQRAIAFNQVLCDYDRSCVADR